MKSFRTKLASAGLLTVVSLALACQRAPEQAATETTPEGTAPTTALAPAPADAPVAAPRPPAARPAPNREPAPAPVARPASRTVTLPAGTPLRVRTTNTISTKLHKTGDTFEVSLAEPIVVGGREVVASNTMLTGRVVDSDPGGRVKGVATLSLELTELRAGGRSTQISTSDVTLQAESSVKKDALKVGIGAAVGTAIGAITGGKKGAGIGAGAGAGAGTGVVLATRGDAAEIGSETLLDFTLSQPATLAAR